MDQMELQNLIEFGLSRLEAAAYIALLQEPGITGYRLSHILNKPTANVYKALSSMKKKGLISADESGKARIFFPVPIGEYLKEQEFLFRKKSRELEAGLRRFSRKDAAARINRLSNFEQVLSKALGLIDEAEHIVVVDAFPEVLDKLRKSLEKKAREGITVIVHTYDEYSLAGCRVIVPESDSGIWRRVPERAFDVAVDGGVFMISNFNLDYTEVIEALYSNHVYLSLMIFNSLAKAVLFYELQEEKGFSPAAREELDRFLEDRSAYLMENLPSVREFFKRVKVDL